MAVTPLIKPIQNKTGIFYNFQSALEDINITLSNSENAVRFSKFVALRIPEIGEPNVLSTDNKIQFLAQGETAIIEGLNPDQNINLATSFQNYALNLEALLLNRPQYKREEKLTIAERVFWKWLKELGAIRFQDANALEKNVSILGNEKRFVEKSETNSTYKRVVKYIGDIDVVNSLKSRVNSYTEVYIHIPTNVGSTPYVLFKSVKDDNYKPNMTITNNPEDPLNIEYLTGRRYNDTHPFGLSMKAYFDLDDQSVNTQISNSISGPLSPGNWFNKNIKNSYYTDDINGEYDVAIDQRILKQKGSTTVEYLRSTLDGICIDFDLANYKLASENPQIKVFSQFNDYVANKDFEFNAILVYYDTYDPNNLSPDGTPLDIRTNLYGIYFLDKVQQSGLEFVIPFIPKFKPDALNKINGTAYAYKLNLKLDNSLEDVKIEKSINDYSTFSLDLFTDVLSQFRSLQSTINDRILSLQKTNQEIENIKDLLINTEDQRELLIRVQNIENSLQENQSIFNNTGEIMRMIENINDRLNDLINGKSNINISYDLNIISAGEGIKVDRKTPKKVRIINNNQLYNISNNSILNIFDNNVIKLSNFTNYIRHENLNNEIVLFRDLEIFIDDSEFSWKTGQTLRLVINDPIYPDLYNIKIRTDALNKKNTGVYGVIITILNDSDFITSNYTPIIEIICINESTLEFRVDKIR